MAMTEVANAAWTRKHENPTIPTVPTAPRTVYPTSLEDLIEIYSSRIGVRQVAARSAEPRHG